ncbi:MAG: translocation/assembly module TamB domain-containing protein [Roseicyclus sp.]
MRRLRFLCLCLGLLLSPPALAQEDDRGRLTRLIESQLSEGADRQVRIEGFRGALSSEASLDRLTISDARGAWLILEDARLDWRRRALLTGALEIRSLTAERLRILRPPLPPEGPDLPSAEATPFSLPDLPVSVEIGQIAIDRLELGEPILGQEAAVTIAGSAELAGGSGALDIAAERLDGPEGRLSAEASFANDTRILDIDVLLDEAPGGLAATLLDLPGAPDLRLEIAGEGPLDDIEVALALATEGTERVTGAVRSARVEETGAQRIDLDLTGDLTPLMAEEYRPFFGSDSVLAAEVMRGPDGATELSDLRLTGAAFEVQGDVSLDAQSRPSAFEITAAIADPDGQGPVRLPVAAQAELGRATLELTFDAAAGEEFRLDAILSELFVAEASVAAASVTSTGRITPTQTGIGAVTAEIAANLSGLDHADPALAAALGDTALLGAEIAWTEGAPLSVEDLSVRAAGASADGRITAGLDGNQLPLTFDLVASLDSLARFSGLAGQDLTGALEASLSGTAEALSGAFDISFVGEARDLGLGDTVPAELLAGPSRIRLDAVRDTQGTRIESLSLDAAGITADGSMTVGAGEGARPLDVDLVASVENIAPFSVLAGQELSGALDATLTGSAEPLSGDFDLTLLGEGRDLRVGDIVPPELLAGASTLRLEAMRDGDSARIESFSFDAAGLAAEGRAEADLGDAALPVRFDLAAEMPSLAPLSALAGQDLRGAADLSLSGTAELETQDFKLSLDGTARDLRVGTAVPPELLAGRTEVRAVAARDGEDLRIDELTVDGRQISVGAEGEIGAGGTGIRATARLADLGLLTTALRGPATLNADLDRAAEGWSVDADLQGPAGLSADVSGLVGLPDGVDLDAQGTVPLELANRFIAPQSVAGPMTFDLAISGAPSLQAVSGEVSTNGARLAVPTAQLALTDIGLSASLQRGRLSLDGGGNVSSGGRVSVSGSLDLASQGLPGDIGVTLDSVRLVDPTLYEVVIARGDLTASGPLAGGLSVAGGVTLAPSELRVPEAGFGTAAPIPDIRHTGETAAERQTRAAAGLIGGNGDPNGDGPAIGLDLTIDAPGRIFLRGRGIDAEFGGQLRIGGTTQDIVPAGRFELVRGRISILGTRLDFIEGAATLQGDFDPFLDLRAQSRAGEYRIFIDVEGPASSPEISLSSEPFLPEDEILAQLLFGRSVSSLSPVQLLQLADAASSLAGGGGPGSGILGGLREGLGLDNLDLQTDAEGNAAVRAGRYLSENVYTDVTVGAGGQSDLSLNIDLTPNVTARGSVSSDGSSSVGVFFERDY